MWPQPDWGPAHLSRHGPPTKVRFHILLGPTARHICQLIEGILSRLGLGASRLGLPPHPLGLLPELHLGGLGHSCLCCMPFKLYLYACSHQVRGKCWGGFTASRRSASQHKQIRSHCKHGVVTSADAPHQSVLKRLQKDSPAAMADSRVLSKPCVATEHDTDTCKMSAYLTIDHIQFGSVATADHGTFSAYLSRLPLVTGLSRLDATAVHHRERHSSVCMDRCQALSLSPQTWQISCNRKPVLKG